MQKRSCLDGGYSDVLTLRKFVELCMCSLSAFLYVWSSVLKKVNKSYLPQTIIIIIQ